MPGTVASERRGRIVVGVDGSRSSRDALHWAARQAELTGAGVQAVIAWALAPTAFPLTTPIPVAYDMSLGARQQLEVIVGEVRRELPSVEVSSVVREGWPGRELLAVAEGADLLVVGSRGYGAVMGLLLGSVSEYCVTHARCPVVVVRHNKDAAAGESGPLDLSAAGLTKGTQRGMVR